MGILSHAADLLRKPWGGFTLTDVLGETKVPMEDAATAAAVRRMYEDDREESGLLE